MIHPRSTTEINFRTMFIGNYSLEYWGISCTETSEANWWNRQYLITKALQQMTLEAMEELA